MRRRCAGYWSKPDSRLTQQEHNLPVPGTPRFTTAGLEGQFKGDNPASNIRHNPETERDRFLSPMEMSTLWKYLEAHDNVDTASVAGNLMLQAGCAKGRTTRTISTCKSSAPNASSIL
jgi:hypothetical protein